MTSHIALKFCCECGYICLIDLDPMIKGDRIAFPCKCGRDNSDKMNEMIVDYHKFVNLINEIHRISIDTIDERKLNKLLDLYNKVVLNEM